MASVHILSQSSDNEFQCVIHFPAPSGSNSAGLSWKSVLLASGLAGSTRLVEGTGPGQITAAEKAQVLAGDVIEFETVLRIESGGSTSLQIGVTIDALVANALADHARKVMSQLRRYGATRP